MNAETESGQWQYAERENKNKSKMTNKMLMWLEH